MKAGSMKFRAVHLGVEIKDGDYWAPGVDKPGPANCYPVFISSAGIHYCRKLIDCDSVEVRAKGEETSYYCEWESNEIYYSDVEVFEI